MDDTVRFAERERFAEVVSGNETSTSFFVSEWRLKSDEGVQAHIKIRAKSSHKVPLFFFTDAKLL